MGAAAGVGLIATALLTAMRARRERELSAARRRKEENDRSFQWAVQNRLAQQHDESMRLQRDQLASVDAQRKDAQERAGMESAEKARQAFLAPGDVYAKSKEDGVPEAVGPILNRMDETSRGWPTAKDDPTLDPGQEGPAQLGTQEDLLARRAQDVAEMRGIADSKASERIARETAHKDAMLRLAEGRLGEARKKTNRVSDKQLEEFGALTEEVGSLDQIVAGAADVREKYPGYWGVKIQDLSKYVQGQGQDPDVAVFISQVEDAVSAKVKARSGAAYSVPELKWLRSMMPNTDDSLQSLTAKAQAIKQYDQWKAANRLRLYRAQGKDVTALADEYRVNPDDPLLAFPPWNEAMSVGTDAGGGNGNVTLPSGRRIQTRRVQ